MSFFDFFGGFLVVSDDV